jgi:PEP-CTERM motif
MTSSIFLQARRRSLAAFALGTLLSLTAAAHATNIVVDPGFESAGTGVAGSYEYFAGQSIDGGAWTVINTGGSVSSTVFIDSSTNLDPLVAFGNNSVNLTTADLFEPNTISQTLSTVAGLKYVFSFYADADTANTFSATENGIVISGTPTSIAQNGFPNANPDSNTSDFTLYTGSFTATSSSTVLDLSATGFPSLDPNSTDSVVIDNVSVSATPEPSSLALLVTGLAGMGQIIRRRRSR